MLKDKVIVIIGGTTGLGRSAALACVGAGARVLVVGRDPSNAAKIDEELGEFGSAVAADACDSETAARAIELACDRFGDLQGLYHVAGGSGRQQGDGALHELDELGWAETLRWNLDSVFYSNRAAVRHFLDRGGGGSVLNMSSVLGFSPSAKYFMTQAYATAKSAIVGFTRTAAARYASENIRFNVLAPALVDTPMARRSSADEDIMQYIGSKQPLDGGRIGRPDDLDAAVVYFLSDASRFVTGQVLAVDGGWTVSEGLFEDP